MMIVFYFEWNRSTTIKLNSCRPTNKFNALKAALNFLGTMIYLYIYIYIKEQNKLLKTVCSNPPDWGNFLHHISAHPKSLIKLYI